MRLGCLLWGGTLFLAGIPLKGQSTQNEFWPEFDYYLQRGEQLRVAMVDSFDQDQQTKYRQGAFAYYVDLALKPVFRRELRGRGDVFRKRYLTFRAGYQYSTSFVNADSTSENRIVAETTSRAPLGGGFVILDRNRGDFRFVKDKPFSMRYRNRLELDRDCTIKGYMFTPYAYDEVFYDTSKSAWVPNRYAFGIQLPIGAHFLAEPYYLRQNNSKATPKHVNAAGLTLDFYF